MTKPDFIPTKVLPELLKTAPVNAIRLTAAGAFGRVISRRPGVNRDNEVLLAAVERHAGRVFSEADIADAAERYRKRQAVQTRCAREWRARLTADQAAALRERNAEQARLRRERLRFVGAAP